MRSLERSVGDAGLRFSKPHCLELRMVAKFLGVFVIEVDPIVGEPPVVKALAPVVWHVGPFREIDERESSARPQHFDLFSGKREIRIWSNVNNLTAEARGMESYHRF